MESILGLYQIWKGQAPVACEKLPGAGSNRRYYRLTDNEGKSVIGCTGTSCEENEAFIYLTKHFAEKGLPVPMILAISQDRLSYIQTDLGTCSLYDALKEGREGALGYRASDILLLQKVIRLLPKIQVKGAEELDFSKCYPLEMMDEQSIMFDLNYFKYCFLKTSGIEFNEVKLEESFKALVTLLQEDMSDNFMYRDFQARNVMLSNDNEPYLIDYQGGRKGPLQYDLISFLWQASSHYTDDIRQFLIDEYIASLKEYKDVDEEAFRRTIPKWVLFRTLQVLGAYGFRGKIEGKKYFLDSIPSAIQNLKEILKEINIDAISYLHETLIRLVNLPEYNINKVNTLPLPTTNEQKDNKLIVKVFSFSYKKGIPEDTSGNGGGYVFDCRSTHNPGRYEPYKKLTGLDKPVIDFLEDDGEINVFLESVYKLADAHVARYIERGFTSLMFSFGCTGGQHRSVYSAEHVAAHLAQKYPDIRVHLIHREQGIDTIL
jgi:aminoglycoside/choline kinase family phosphotransferase